MIDPVSGEPVIDVMEGLKAAGLQYQTFLDHGVVEVVDVMPRLIPERLKDTLRCDYAIPEAARISYQGGTTTARADGSLIDYLIAHRHTSPIEMCEVKFRLRMPIAIMRQHVRHRTSSLNEESARYSQLSSDFYIPEEWTINKGRQMTEKAGFISDETRSALTAAFERISSTQYDLYEALLNPEEAAAPNEFADLAKMLVVEGVTTSREQARFVLGTNIYTSCIWKIDLKNLLHYIHLRGDKHAQYEIREMAQCMAGAIDYLFPVSSASYYDNFIGGLSLSATEQEIFTALMKDDIDVPVNMVKELALSKRRKTEIAEKFLSLCGKNLKSVAFSRMIHE